MVEPRAPASAHTVVVQRRLAMRFYGFNDLVDLNPLVVVVSGEVGQNWVFQLWVAA